MNEVEVDPEVALFFPYRTEISCSQGMILRGERIIIPKSLRSDIKKCIHQGHQGIVRCKRRAQRSVFWPNINNQIEIMVSQCSECKDLRNKQPKETMIEHEVPEGPWEKVGSDILTIYGKDYLLAVDYYSKFFEISPLETPCKSLDAITALKKIFSRHGIPNLLYTDNASQYDCAEFREFSCWWDFDHDT